MLLKAMFPTAIQEMHLVASVWKVKKILVLSMNADYKESMQETSPSKSPELKSVREFSTHKFKQYFNLHAPSACQRHLNFPSEAQ